MPRPRSETPEYRSHISGQARVYLDGKYYYLGEYDSPESRTKYRRLLAKYLANDCRMPVEEPTHQAETEITVSHITAEYRRLIDERPRLKRHENLCTLLEDEYGDLPADEFGPVKLSAVRELFVASGNARPTVNKYTRRIKLIFKHAVSRQLIDLNVYLRLDTLPPLEKHDTTAPEYKKRQPVDIKIVTKTAKYLSPQAHAIIALQAATAMRPSEIFNMRPCDIDRSGDVWFYRPQHHKTESHDIEKSVPIINEARELLLPFLVRAADDYCFSPAESAQWHRDQRTANRKTPPRYGNRPGTNRKAKPKKQPGRKFTKDGLNQAVQRACKKAGVPKWTPYQLRHTAATEVARAKGLDVARAFLGHTTEKMTRNYVKQMQDNEKAIEAAKVAPRIG